MYYNYKLLLHWGNERELSSFSNFFLERKVRNSRELPTGSQNKRDFRVAVTFGILRYFPSTPVFHYHVKGKLEKLTFYLLKGLKLVDKIGYGNDRNLERIKLISKGGVSVNLQLWNIFRQLVLVIISILECLKINFTKRSLTPKDLRNFFFAF